MKIAIILPSLAHTGPILVAKDIVDFIYDKVDTVHVYYFDAIEEVVFKCSVYQIDFNEKIDFDAYDVIHSHMYRPDKYISINRKYIKAICLSTVHCDVRTDLRYNYNLAVSWIFRWVWLYYFSKQDKLVFISEDLKNRYYSKFFREDKMAVIHNGRQLPSALPLAEEDLLLFDQIKKMNLKILGACALLTRRKGIHQIIDALPLLPDYALVIVGDGKEKKNLMEQAQKLGVANRCFFLGFRKGAEKFLPYFDVYMMTSLFEGFGLALVEAAFAKKSCVCSDIDVFREMFTEEEITFFKIDNIPSLVNAIASAYINRQQKGIEAFKSASVKFTTEKMGNRYLNLYKSFIHV